MTTTPGLPQSAGANIRERNSAPQRSIWIVAFLVAVIVVATGIAFHILSGGRSTGGSGGTSAAAFVGSESCAGCHQTEAELWRSSQHRQAMAPASEASVLGDFSDASFEYYGLKSRFFRQDGKFLIETDGPDGNPAIFEVKYTFGIDPLQQYLIAFPDGRLQALSIAWDSRPKDQGGQRWFHLYGNEQIKHDDILHWTRLNQNWNSMCAECHSTGVRKNYNAATDQFATMWAEINVGCEACHGQGSNHVAWAEAQRRWWPFGKRGDPAGGLLVRFDERQGVEWPHDPRSGEPRRSIAPARLRKEVETCGRCHARRSTISEDWVPGRWLSDSHVVSPLTRGLFQTDGQMLDEVYNYAPFKQSRMFAAGVTCSDCHEPHGAKIRSPGDGVCLQCHASGKYAATSHRHHDSASTPLTCESCHMPERIYMVVDRRHDHSFRIPRPDVSAKLGTPNACNDCHRDRTAEWAASEIERWHGPNRRGLQNYAEAFSATWAGRNETAALLGKIAGDHRVTAFVRASALPELASSLSPSNVNLAREGLSDSDPMVRIGALDMLGNIPASQIWPLASPLLSDPSRGVRIKAAALLAAVPTTNQPPVDRERFDHAAAEFIAAQRLNADRPEARSALGDFYARRRLASEAESEYRAALRLSAQFAPAAINLAELYRDTGRDREGERVLRSAINNSPGDAGLHHALGLALVRLKRADQAIVELRHASELEPERGRYLYVYAVALHSSGHRDEAIAILKDYLNRRVEDRDILLAVVTFSRDAGDLATALEYGERLVRLAPDDRNIVDFIRSLSTSHPDKPKQ